ncbi:MAG TPA: peptide transporter [Candidatus Latescibacteria bacterium]|nr:peptide transporter [Candidatus Latescibacterota bacterium]
MTTGTGRTGTSARDEYQIVSPDAPFEPGFNIKTLLAALFVGFLMLPGAIYLGLVTGQSMAGGAEWVTLILFIEIAKRSFVHLRTQEIIILYWVAGGLVVMGGKLGTGADLFGGPFGVLIWDQYLIQSPQADGLAQYIPSWVVPERGSEALLDRTFLHADWLAPVLILVVAVTLQRINALSLGYVLFRITSDIERLPFPMAYVQAGGATALAETSSKKEGWRWQVFSTGTFIGATWGLVYVGVPTLSGVFLTETVSILPIPFIDFTVPVKSVLPAAVLGVGTDLVHLFIGLVLPLWIVVGAFASSMLVNLVANPLLYAEGILHTWSPGMSAIPTMVANSFDFWLSFSIGGAIAVAVVGFWTAGRAMMAASRAARDQPAVEARSRNEGRGDMPIWLALGIWGLSTTGFVAMVAYLVPQFPIWITLFFGFVWTPIYSYIGARMIGLTGSPQGVTFPYLREASFYMSGYQGASIWFAPVPIFQWGYEVQAFRQLEITKTSFGSLVKMTAITLVVMFVCSFLFWSWIWNLGDIPSSAYPYVQKFWPFHATMQSFWAKSTLPGAAATGVVEQIIRWDYIGIGLASSGLLYAALVVAHAPVAIFYGFVAGLGQWPHFVILNFIGALLGHFHMRPRFGAERWRAYAPILLAGYSCGVGLVGMTAIAIALISKSVSQVIY